MLERIVENWLTKCTERDFEVPFAQLLSLEGHKVLHGPVHHPFEHGKDIIGYDASGALCAWQLKDDDIGLSELERYQPQLLALTATAVTYPGVEPARRPDRVFLVTNGVLTPPARSRLEAFNQGNSSLGYGPIEVVEKEHLISRFVNAHGKYLPIEPSDFNALLRFYLSDGKEQFPIRKFSQFIDDMVLLPGPNPTDAQLSKAVASALLLTGYVVGAWQKTQNHLAVAQGWLVYAGAILHAAAKYGTENDDTWLDSYDLAMTSARDSLRSLIDEVMARDDLVVPDLVEGVVYPTRVILVCGFLAAHFISERALEEHDPIKSAVLAVLKRELTFLKVVGEYATPYLICIGTALELLEEPLVGRSLLFTYAKDLARANQHDSKEGALADPYHDFEDVLKRIFGADVESPDEQFEGHAYTLHLMIDWLARRGERKAVAAIWEHVTRLTLCEFRVANPASLLAFEDKDGSLHMWQPDAPESWKRLSEASERMTESQLPAVLWRHAEFLPYLVLLFPHRFVSATEKAIEHLATGRVNVTFDN